MNARDTLLRLVSGEAPPDYTPAGFFMHFDPSCHQGQAAIDKHLAFFRATGMDFVKVQYEQLVPSEPKIRTPADWARVQPVDEAYFEPSIGVVEGLVKAVQGQALVIMTIYSPFMWANHYATPAVVADHLRTDPAAVANGLAVMTENVRTLVRGCRQVGVDGFYISTQGGESFRFAGTSIFQQYIKPTDLAVWAEAASCPFNILHVCDYQGGYDDLTPFLDYPGHVVNCSLKLGDREMTPTEAARLFGRPFMGGLERKGVIATGDATAIQQAAEEVLRVAPERFILAADCTVPSETPWENLKTAIDVAHQYRR